jgi:hypothetical protein
MAENEQEGEALVPQNGNAVSIQWRQQNLTEFPSNLKNVKLSSKKKNIFERHPKMFAL